jgi:hypothetical protein
LSVLKFQQGLLPMPAEDLIEMLLAQVHS